MSAIRCMILGAFALAAAGCATVTPKDYTEFHKSHPRSILVLPPVNESTDVGATYSIYSTMTRPLAELGYYVLPIVLVDRFLKENGLAMPEEMHQAPLEKLREVFGADAVLYLTIQRFGSKYQVITTTTVVDARAKLVDCRSGVLLWEGNVHTELGGQAGLVEALVSQVVNKLSDQSHVAATVATTQLLTTPGQGLPKGPRSPEYEP